jgi:hypothetical protein
MLTIAYEAPIRGQVSVIKGQPATIDELSKLTGTPVETVAELVAELDRNGVFSRTRTGVIFSRRMINDAKKADKAKINGRKGGNPTLSKQKANGQSVNLPLKPSRARHLEARSQRREEREEDPCSGGNPDPRARRPETVTAAASDFHSRALAAAGVDATRDVTGKWHSSTQIWTAERWRTDLGLTADEVCAVLASTVARHRNGPIGTLAYFDGAMQDAAGRKQAEPLRPVVPPPKSDAFADRLAAWGIPSE